MRTRTALAAGLTGVLLFSLLLSGCDRAPQPAAEAPTDTTTTAAVPAPAEPAAASPHAFDAAMQGEMGGKMSPHAVDPNAAPGSGKAIVPFADLKIDKATGANSFTVAELFAKAAELNGQKVRVRGQLVKVSPNIMGRNWLHLQDGSGSPLDNTHDLVITTDQTPQTGDTVTIEGILSANKDFGAGYLYAAIVEEARIEAQ